MSENDPMSRYNKVRQIGKGSYGEVFLMRDTRTKDYVVVKIISASTKNQKALSDAKKEASLLNRLRHPNVVLYIDSFLNKKGEFCIVTEYADGKDLKNHLDSNKNIPENEILEIFTQIILGLEYIHSQKVIHRDIKTANIFLFKKGLVKLGDFGISRTIRDDNLASTMIGTPYFMSPELLQNKEYGFPTDIWAAGCVLYELMTNQHAFTGKSRDELFNNILSGKMPEMPKQYSKDLIDLLCKMLQSDPTKRPTCKEILGTSIMERALDHLQAVLQKRFGNRKSQIPLPPNSHMANNSSRQATQNSARSTAGDSDDDNVDQTTPEWLKDDQSGINIELQRQSMRHIDKDSNWLLGYIRSSLRALPGAPTKPTPIKTVTGNINSRKMELEKEARNYLGNNYDRAYKYIQQYCQDKREELLKEIGSDTNTLKCIKNIEIIIAIEELS